MAFQYRSYFTPPAPTVSIYVVGEKVRVRVDLVEGTSEQGTISPRMLKYRGRELAVKGHDHAGRVILYTDNPYYWHDDWLVNTEVEEP